MLDTDELTTEQAAPILRVKPGTLKKWRTKKFKKGPPYRKYGGRVFYIRSEIEKWKSEQTIIPESYIV